MFCCTPPWVEKFAFVEIWFPEPDVLKSVGGDVLLRRDRFENSTGAYAALARAIPSTWICGFSFSAWMPRLFSSDIRTASSIDSGDPCTGAATDDTGAGG